MTPLPEGYVFRSPRASDIDDVLALLHAGDVRDLGAPTTPRTFVAESWSSPYIDPSRDLAIVIDRTGTVAAFGELRIFDDEASAEAFVRTHPAHLGRGLATAVLDRLQAVARERLGPDGASRPFRTDIAEPDDLGRALLEARGAREVRRFVHMEGRLDGRGVVAEPPPGVVLRTFDPSADWEAFHRTIEEGFAEHWGWGRVTLASFRAQFEDSHGWDPDLVCFAEKDGVPVGVVASSTMSDPGLAWIGDLTVLRPYRGRGIAKALLARTFTDLAARGCSIVRLNVDATNTTGATALYRSVGMTVHRGWVVFEQPLGGPA